MTRGLISELDSQTLETVIRMLARDSSFYVAVTEVGLFNGQTGLGIASLLQELKVDYELTGIDNEKDKPLIEMPHYTRIIKGNSNEVYHLLANESQDLIFVDANHSYPYVVQDFFCYMDKVCPEGYFCFHDTGRHIKPFDGYQSGDISNPDSYVAVRKALKKIGLLDDKFEGWELVFDRADETDQFGGICVFKKLK
jgi:hypothetical protein